MQMSWRELARDNPELAAFGQERLHDKDNILELFGIARWRIRLQLHSRIDAGLHFGLF
jgi:hypothetical protein